MNRTITPQETNQLFEFCRKHYVPQYDLQVELVDHLATAIEEQWIKNPEISFDTALYGTFKQFGISGFSKIKAQKQKELARKYSRLLWKYFLEFYRWPKIVMTLALTLALFTVLKVVNSIAWVLLPYFAMLVIGGYIYYFFLAPKKLKIETNTKKKFMIIEYMNGIQMGAILLSQLPAAMYNISRHMDLHAVHQSWALLLTSFLIISLNIVLWGNFFYIPEKIKEHFKEQFPEFAV
jgi:hypothetical protein